MARKHDTRIDLEKTMRFMDVADEIRRQQRRVQEHVEQTDRDQIKAHLMQRYEELGYKADPQLLDEAIETVLAQQYRFRAPQDGFGLTLAKIFVRRAELTRKIGIPVVAVTVLVGLVSLGAMAVNEIRYRSQEREVEEAIVALHSKSEQLTAEFEQLSANPVRTQLTQPDGMTFEERITSAKTSLALAKDFLEEYAPSGALESVTREDLPGVAEQARRADASLEDARDCLAEAANLIRLQAELDRIRLSLGNLVADVRSADAPKTFVERAELIYASGLRSVDGRQLDEAKKQERQLVELGKSLAELQLLPAQALSLYQQIQSVAKEPNAVTQAAQHYEEAQRQISSADVPRAREAIAELETLDRTLELEYTIIITAGRERDRVRHYLIVQALDSDDRPVKMKIRNEETGRVHEVTEWGERVPKAIYEQVERDYLDDRVINDNFFGRKLRGYLTPERRFEHLGQITRW
ncbi:MAG: hypothetical protein JSU87_04945 [Gemmatimonadota bacterium]|nr:MAG: hypothetical protein JSU87_04945 [Gemmatimonadota bacterium]